MRLRRPEPGAGPPCFFLSPRCLDLPAQTPEAGPPGILRGLSTLRSTEGLVPTPPTPTPGTQRGRAQPGPATGHKVAGNSRGVNMDRSKGEKLAFLDCTL